MIYLRDVCLIVFVCDCWAPSRVIIKVMDVDPCPTLLAVLETAKSEAVQFGESSHRGKRRRRLVWKKRQSSVRSRS